MIPKVIHYCWFGGKELPKLAKKCIKSWKKHCPDYEIVRWDESNFDINSNRYVKEAYESNKYAFVSDYVRLYVLYNYGGIYMDTDVEVVKPLDSLLNERAFSGFESDEYVLTGIVASIANLKIFKELLDYYNDRGFILKDGKMDLKTNVKVVTEIFEKKSLIKNNKYQTIEEFSFYPQNVFCPDTSKKDYITDSTYTIHWFSGSWRPYKDRVKSKIYFLCKKIFGEQFAKSIRKLVRGEKE